MEQQFLRKASVQRRMATLDPTRRAVPRRHVGMGDL